ncbi:hypothetical protein LTR37_020177 [Vermiconidia calcicola]|uniref:Uncharacterized protein n=1 Tax=Vermiconidia calcicola TaxID=1690605 RepID=A0ACC3MD97_9PEZI|nr:hypothetical protein LTR37_020177 [Vermiconidia calcicola]
MAPSNARTMPPSTPNQYPPKTPRNTSSYITYKSAFDDIVEIRAGENEDAKSFHMHKGVLCFYSGYFARALNGTFAEASKGVVELKTEDKNVFEMFEYWTYGRRFCEPAQSYTGAIVWLDIAKLWIFGDSHHIPLLQNDVIDLMKTVVVNYWVIPTSPTNHIYENTVPTAPLRKFVIDIIGRTSGPIGFNKANMSADLPKDALIDLVHVVWETSLESNRWTKEDVK